MRVSFTKMTGAGNDFVVIDNRSGFVRRPARLARLVCDRRWGIGADGLLLLERSVKADYRMAYYNADGSHGGMCGNGGRCIALFSVLMDITPKRHTIEALHYLYRANVLSSRRITLAMKNPHGERMSLLIRTRFGNAFGDFLDTGSPHFVSWGRSPRSRWTNLEELPVEELGRAIRFHPAFKPAGTNVNFARIGPRGQVAIRTYERGVEAETLACGTGSIAAALSFSRRHRLTSPVRVRVRSGSTLKIDYKRRHNSFTGIRLTGPAQVTFEGVVDIPI